MERANKLRRTARAALTGALACGALAIPAPALAGAASWHQAYKWTSCYQQPALQPTANYVPKECSSTSGASHSGLLRAKAAWTGQGSTELGSGLSGAGASVHRLVKIDRPGPIVFTGTFGVASGAISASATTGTRARVELLIAVHPLSRPESEVVARTYPAYSLLEADGSQTAPAGDRKLTVVLPGEPGWYRMMQVIFVFGTGPHRLGPPAKATAEATVVAKGFTIEQPIPIPS